MRRKRVQITGFVIFEDPWTLESRASTNWASNFCHPVKLGWPSVPVVIRCCHIVSGSKCACLGTVPDRPTGDAGAFPDLPMLRRQVDIGGRRTACTRPASRLSPSSGDRSVAANSSCKTAPTVTSRMCALSGVRQRSRAIATLTLFQSRCSRWRLGRPLQLRKQLYPPGR
jgi:hypothetical protein